MSDTRGTYPLLRYLQLDGLLSEEVVQQVQVALEREAMTVPQYLVQHQLLSSAVILACAQRHLSHPTHTLRSDTIMPLTPAPLNAALIHRYRVIPLKQEYQRLYIGMSDPTDNATLNAIQFHTGLTIRPQLVDEELLDKALTHFFPLIGMDHLQSALNAMHTPSLPSSTTAATIDTDEEPIIQFVNNMLAQAIAQSASDIHIEPMVHQTRIRFRCDGRLQEVLHLPHTLTTRVIARLKIMAHMNIAEKRHPQDGRIMDTKFDAISMRISTCPTLYGEKLQCRLIPNESALSLHSLGLLPAQYELLVHALTQAQGLILVTGPTGSGKSVTLNTALRYLNDSTRNICTLEDPIEATVPGVNHIAINHTMGLDFATLMRTLLRQDPDIMMIGEIRDADSAHIALQAAQTGHLVLATLHSHHAIGALNRLQFMGLDLRYYHDTLSLIVAQRLVRQLCTQCKQADHEQHDTQCLRYKALGCEQCRDGFRGRIGIFECLACTPALLLRSMQHPEAPLLTQGNAQRFIPLWEAGLAKVDAGITSMQELQRVITPLATA